MTIPDAVFLKRSPAPRAAEQPTGIDPSNSSKEERKNRVTT